MRCKISIVTLLGAVILLTSGCQSPATPAPTPQLQQVGVTPLYLDWVSDSLSTYRSTYREANFRLDLYTIDAGLNAVQKREIELLVGAIEPEVATFSAPLFQDGIAVIHHPDINLQDMTVDDLRRVFSGSKQNWQELGGEDVPILPVVPLPGDDLRIIFQRRVMGNFKFSTLARLQADPAQTIILVATKPGAVGFIPFTELDDDSAVFRIEGQSPSSRSIDEGRYTLSYWVAAVAHHEPGGAARAWLSWIQAQNN